MKLRAVSLGKLGEETIADIRIWRNQDFVRKNMIHQHIISEEEHQQYITRLKQKENAGLFVLYLDDEPFGVYQYELDYEKDQVVDGIYLIKEEYKKMGYGGFFDYFACRMCLEYWHINYRYCSILSTNDDKIKIINQTKPVKVEKDIFHSDGQKSDLYYYRWEAKNFLLKRQELYECLIDAEPIEDILLI